MRTLLQWCIREVLERLAYRADMKSAPTNATIAARIRSFVGVDFMSTLFSHHT